MCDEGMRNLGSQQEGVLPSRYTGTTVSRAVSWRPALCGAAKCFQEKNVNKTGCTDMLSNFVGTLPCPQESKFALCSKGDF